MGAQLTARIERSGSSGKQAGKKKNKYRGQTYEPPETQAYALSVPNKAYPLNCPSGSI